MRAAGRWWVVLLRTAMMAQRAMAEPQSVMAEPPSWTYWPWDWRGVE